MFDRVQNTSLGVKEIKTRESDKFDMFYLNTFVIKENKRSQWCKLFSGWEISSSVLKENLKDDIFEKGKTL